MNYGVDFWDADKHWGFLQVDPINLSMHSKRTSLHIWNISRKTWEMKLIFWLQINSKVFYKLIASLWLCVAVMLKVPKITNKQYLWNILWNMWRMKFFFCLKITIKNVFKLILSFLMCLPRHDQITQNNNFTISLQYVKKEVSDDVDFLHTD